MAEWIPSPNFHKGRNRPLAFIVWHSTENDEHDGMARNVAANWFAKTASKVSAHVVVDAKVVVECVKPGDTAWHCANGNADGYGIELVGRSNQTAAQWSDDYSLAAIRNACAWIKSVPVLAALPARWLTDDQLRNHERGHTTHLQVSRVLGGTNHTDPGPGFPRDYVMQQFGGGGGPIVPVPRDLRQGDSGPDVRHLQEVLLAGFPSLAHWSPATDFFGKMTDAAVRAVQKKFGLGVDGVVGKDTRKVLGL